MSARSQRLPSGPPEFLLLLLYIAAVPLMSGTHISLGGQRLLPADFLFVAVVLLWFPTALRGNLLLHLFEVFLLLYLGATVVSTLVSGAGYAGVVKVFYLVAVAGLTRRIVERSPESAVTAWLAGTGAVLAGAFVGAVTFYLGWSSPTENLLLGHYGSLPPGHYPRLSSSFFGPNMLCNYLIVGATLAWYRRHRLLVAGIVGAALFTFSPGLGGMALALGQSARRWRGAAALGILLALLSLGLIVVSRVSLLEGHLAPSGRVLTWQQALATWVDHPLTGAGPGALRIDVRYQLDRGGTMRMSDPHNVWLSVGAQTGILGVAALLALILYSRRRTPSRLPGLRDALKTALVGAWLVHGLSGSLEDSRHLWVLLGMLAATEDRLT